MNKISEAKLKKAMSLLNHANTILRDLQEPKKEKEQPYEDERSSFIKGVVSTVFNKDPLLRTRSSEISIVRHALRYCLFKKTNRTLLSISLITNGVEHSSVSNSIEVCEDLMFSDSAYKELVLLCLNKIPDMPTGR